MNEAAFTELTGLLDDAIQLADDAVKAAEARPAAPATPPAQESVRLVKVASQRYMETAKELLKTGAFRGHSAESLANILREAGTADFLEIMEKLASRAVFPISAEEAMGGDLVEPSAENRDGRQSSSGSPQIDLWVDACRSAGMNV